MPQPLRPHPILAACLGLALAAPPVTAQDRAPSHCIAIADAGPGITFVDAARPAETLTRTQVVPPDDEYTVRIRYIDHSQFLIATAGGLGAVTDYNGWLGETDYVPDVVTMNNSHSSHWTAAPDRGIPNVLEGWRQGDAPAEHYLDLGEMLVRNVTTNVRGFGDGMIVDNNSIFVFEVAGLCIGHLGHLHHEPSDEDYAALGRVDVLMAAVDGGMTVDLPTMTRIVERLRSSVVIPMHWFSGYSLDAFLAGIDRQVFDVVRDGEHTLDVSLRTLPDRPTIVVLDPMPLGFGE